jgi:photosystem II stability/assembly factor-like uncharacterized protein
LFYDITGSLWDGEKFFVAGQKYELVGNQYVNAGVISTSADGSTWSQVYLNTTKGKLHSLAKGGQTYIAVGNAGQIVRSTSGGASGTWAPVSSPTTLTLTGVAYGSGTFIAVGYGNDYTPVVLSSTNGSTWADITARVGFTGTPQIPCYFDQVAYLHDRFVFSGYNFGLRYSTDGGQTFTRAFPENLGYLDHTPALAYGDGMWLASGDNHLAGKVGQPVDLFSTDGTNWVRLESPNRTSLLHAAVFYNHTFIAVGDDHTIWQSQPMYPTCATQFCDWRETHFPGHGSDSVPTADADGDGVANLVEYQFGLNPLVPDACDAIARLPMAATSTSLPQGTKRLALRFTIPDPVPADFKQTVQYADSLDGTWTDLASKTGGAPWTGTGRVTTGTPSNGRVEVTVEDNQDMTTSPSRFLRLKSSPVQ